MMLYSSQGFTVKELVNAMRVLESEGCGDFKIHTCGLFSGQTYSGKPIEVYVDSWKNKVVIVSEAE